MTIKVASAQVLLTILAQRQKCLKTVVPIHCWSLQQPTVLETQHTSPAFTPMFTGWLVRSLVHGLVLMIKHEKFSLGLNGVFWPVVSTLSWKITLCLPQQSTSHLVMIYVYIPDVANTILGFHTLYLLLWLQYALASDHCIYFLITPVTVWLLIHHL